ncbi:MAG: hypothetical protein GKS05_07360 [Nitrospirales bacterium]|nr:hypothetical protein [Nitrospirales bacterium]
MLTKPTNTSRHVLIVGSNLAGLTTALRLLQQGFSVTILCPPPQAPPHLLTTMPHAAASLPEHEQFRLTHFDEPWPFILQGFQQATLSLLQEIGSSHRLSWPSHMSLFFVSSLGRHRRLPLFCLPAPFHSLLGLLVFQGLSLKARLHILNHIEKLWEETIALPLGLDQQTADAWLLNTGHPALALQQVWNPLCRFLLGDHLSNTSADHFTSALTRSFLSKRSHAYVNLPAHNVQESLFTPLWKQIREHGGIIRVKTQPHSFQVNGTHITGVHIQDGTSLNADWYVAAMEPYALTALLPERVLAKSAYFYHLNHLWQVPALTIHIRVAASQIRPRLFLSNGTFQWITFRNEAKINTCLISCMSTADTQRLEQSDQDLLACAWKEIHQIVPHQDGLSSSDSLEHQIFRHHRAFLSPAPGITAYRPSQQSPLPNLFLTGDWTETGLSAGVESAIVSGNRCSASIVAMNARRNIDNTNHAP